MLTMLLLPPPLQWNRLVATATSRRFFCSGWRGRSSPLLQYYSPNRNSVWRREPQPTNIPNATTGTHFAATATAAVSSSLFGWSGGALVVTRGFANHRVRVWFGLVCVCYCVFLGGCVLCPSPVYERERRINRFSGSQFHRIVRAWCLSITQHQRLLKHAKGYRGRSKNCFVIAIRRVQKAWQYAYRDRKVKKRLWRTLWIQRLSAASRQYQLRYSRLIAGLNYSTIPLNRKVLSELAATEPFAFKAVIDVIQHQQAEYDATKI